MCGNSAFDVLIETLDDALVPYGEMTETIDAVMQFTENHDDQREADRGLVRALSDNDRLRKALHDARDESTAPDNQAPRGDHAAVRIGQDVADYGGRRRAMRPGILAEPTPHIGKIYELTDRAPTLSCRLLNSTRVRSAGRSRTWTFPSSPGAGAPAVRNVTHVAAHLITMAALHRQNRDDRDTDHVRKLTGSPTMPIGDFVRMHAAEFEGKGGRA